MSEERDHDPLAYLIAYDPRGTGKGVLDVLDGNSPGIRGSLEILFFNPRTRGDYTGGPICICRAGPVIATLDQDGDIRRVYTIPSPNQRGSFRDFPGRGRLISGMPDIMSRTRKSPSLVSAGICLVDAIADLGFLKANRGCWYEFPLVVDRKGKEEAKGVGLLLLN